MDKPFIPPKKILERYADVLVNYALGNGKGIKKGDVVLVQAPEIAKPLYAEVLRAIWKKGGHVIGRFSPSNDENFKFDREFYLLADKQQLNFFPEKLMRGQIEDINHTLSIIAETDKNSMKGVDPKKMMMRGEAWKPYISWKREKENRKEFTWTVGLYGTSAMAKEAQITEKEYWDQIVRACFLSKDNPIKEWKLVSKKIDTYISKLDGLKIEQLHVEGPDVDLWIKIGEKRRWRGGGGANIPSFEIFTSPDWRGTNGWIKFNQPLYRYGSLIEGIELHFKDGIVTKSKASKNEKVLKAMIATKNANKIGEYSLTDTRFSKITKFMAETLYDENIGGPYGNTHLALGSSYHECFHGDPSQITSHKWEELGFNSSSVHTDIISTSPRTVTAFMKDGQSKVIYKDGQFTL
jgi:aminopeptidase